MPTTSRIFLGGGALLLLLATALGAYGTHALATQLPAASWNAYSTAVDYQFYHGLGLLAVALLGTLNPRLKSLQIAGWLILIGTVLFCGSIYATTLGAPAGIGALAPIGGTAFMAGWLAVASGAWVAGRGPADPLA